MCERHQTLVWWGIYFEQVFAAMLLIGMHFAAITTVAMLDGNVIVIRSYPLPMQQNQ